MNEVVFSKIILLETVWIFHLASPNNNNCTVDKGKLDFHNTIQDIHFTVKTLKFMQTFMSNDAVVNQLDLLPLSLSHGSHFVHPNPPKMKASLSIIANNRRYRM